jgi:hypothetical protein
VLRIHPKTVARAQNYLVTNFYGLWRLRWPPVALFREAWQTATQVCGLPPPLRPPQLQPQPPQPPQSRTSGCHPDPTAAAEPEPQLSPASCRSSCGSNTTRAESTGVLGVRQTRRVLRPKSTSLVAVRLTPLTREADAARHTPRPGSSVAPAAA